MSHVDEGALHAYLDGALEEYPTGEARRIRAHLERCEACAEALAGARRVRDQADMLLGIPEVDVSAPPLEELRRLARSAPEGGEASPRRVPLYRLGWAASVVLALGVGWMLRGGVPEGTAPTVASATADAAPSVAEEETPATARQEASSPVTLAEAPGRETVAADAADRVVSEPARAQAGRMAEAVPAAPDPSMPPDMDVAAVDMAYADQTDSAEEIVEAMASTFEDSAVAGERAAPTAAGALPADVETARVADAATLDTPRAEERRAVGNSRLALEARSTPVASALQAGATASDAVETERGRGDDVAEPGSLVVPGLEVVTIVWREEGVVPAGVRVLQRLDDGALLELVHLPAGFDPGSVTVVEPGVEELVVPRDQGWLIMRAPRTLGELRALLERMDAPSPD